MRRRCRTMKSPHRCGEGLVMGWTLSAVSTSAPRLQGDHMSPRAQQRLVEFRSPTLPTWQAAEIRCSQRRSSVPILDAPNVREPTRGVSVTGATRTGPSLQPERAWPFIARTGTTKRWKIEHLIGSARAQSRGDGSPPYALCRAGTSDPPVGYHGRTARRCQDESAVGLSFT